MADVNDQKFLGHGNESYCYYILYLDTFMKIFAGCKGSNLSCHDNECYCYN